MSQKQEIQRRKTTLWKSFMISRLLRLLLKGSILKSFRKFVQ